MADTYIGFENTTTYGVNAGHQRRLFETQSGTIIVFRNEATSIYYNISTDNGATWETKVLVITSIYYFDVYHDETTDDFYIVTLPSSGTNLYAIKLTNNGDGTWTEGTNYLFGSLSGARNIKLYKRGARWWVGIGSRYWYSDTFEAASWTVTVMSGFPAFPENTSWSCDIEEYGTDLFYVIVSGHNIYDYNMKIWKLATATSFGAWSAGVQLSTRGVAKSGIANTNFCVLHSHADGLYLIYPTSSGLTSLLLNSAMAVVSTTVISPNALDNNPSIAVSGSRFLCCFCWYDSTDRYVAYCSKSSGNTWSSPEKMPVNNTYSTPRQITGPSIMRTNQGGDFLYAYTTPGNGAEQTTWFGKSLNFIPPWVDRIGEYIEPPCGYAGQAVSSIADLSHLEGQTVSILANGIVLDDQVVSGGTIDLGDSYSTVHVGLPYYSDLETLKINVPLKGQTMQGAKVKVPNVTFHLQDTRGGFIGMNDTDLFEGFTPHYIRDYSGVDIDDTELYTGKFRQSLGSQYDNGGNIFYRQSKPLPVTIGSITPEVDVGGKSR